MVTLRFLTKPGWFGALVFGHAGVFAKDMQPGLMTSVISQSDIAKRGHTQTWKP